MSLPTTYLFVPGNRPDRFDKALNSGADAIILDLEDAVDPASKDAAREAVGAWLDSGHATDGRVLIRINDDTTPGTAAIAPCSTVSAPSASSCRRRNGRTRSRRCPRAGSWC